MIVATLIIVHERAQRTQRKYGYTDFCEDETSDVTDLGTANGVEWLQTVGRVPHPAENCRAGTMTPPCE